MLGSRIPRPRSWLIAGDLLQQSPLAVACFIAEDVTKLLQSSVAYMKNKSYLCTVFFMVLDFKVNEKGLS